MSNWICCQIGAREHYAIPRALHQYGNLACLITDAWVAPNSPFAIFNKTGLRERFHPTLVNAKVHAFNASLIGFEITQKAQRHLNWEQITARNHWFQQQAIKKITELTSQLSTPPVLFSYSYAAIDLFRFAKKQGWRTILGQIDPGILEEVIVAESYQQYPQYHSDWQPAPPSYWHNWQEECQLADAIVVNSDWSLMLLEKAGIEPNKMKIIPLVYTPPEATKSFIRSYPDSFTQERPLRVLFLGQVILRKGIAHVLEAIKSLESYPVEFWIVGSLQIEIPIYFQNHPKIRWVGHVNRSKTASYYQLADVFLFPTLSDGCGITQLEAQAWQLPIIASQNCGEVVVHSQNGCLLSEVSKEEIVNALRFCIDNPNYLEKLSKQTIIKQGFDLPSLNEKLQQISTS